MVNLPNATPVVLRDHVDSFYADVITDRTDNIVPSMIEFLGRMNHGWQSSTLPLQEREGEVAGVSSRVKGSGPPLVLRPLEYTSSQWDSLVPKLAQNYSTITLGGAWLGVVAVMDVRAKGSYLDAVQRLIDETGLQPGERVLDVGCGPGSLDRWLVRNTSVANPIAGVDISAHLVREAISIARSEGLEDIILLEEASAEDLPFPDGSFDVCVFFTVAQAVDADRMLGEMVRVTRLGGRIGVLARGDARPYFINLLLRAEIIAKAEAPLSRPSNPAGCADVSLYRRFHLAGLPKVKMFRYLTAETGPPRLRSMEVDGLSRLTSEEAEEWRIALTESQADRTLFIAVPFHCAVGTNSA